MQTSMTDLSIYKKLIVCENNGMKRILLVKTSSLGDVIHNLPVVNDILQYHANAQIDWVVEESFADIPKLHPAIRQVFTVAVRRWRKQMFSKKTWQEIAEFKSQISKTAYDYVIDTQGLIKSAVMCNFAQGTKFGFDKHTVREPVASYFYDQYFNVERGQHAIERNRALVASACGYKKPNNAPIYGITTENLTADLTLPKPFIVGLHGTSKESKLWPTDHWISLAKKLSEQNCHLVLPWASNAEQQRAHDIAINLNNVIVLPKQSIMQLATIISRAWVAVGVDTGLSHLSAALNIPTVAIYTDTNPALTGVMAAENGQAVNLGGTKQTPTVASVLSAIQRITASNNG
jgi:heptosyltransferase I